MRCNRCHDQLFHCHDVSIEHDDGATECLDPACDLPHHLHDWQLRAA